MAISEGLQSFLDAEYHNYLLMVNEDSSTSHPTLMSTWDSLTQAPYNVLLDWFKVTGVGLGMTDEDNEPLTRYLLELGWLICTNNPHTPLDHFVPHG